MSRKNAAIALSLTAVLAVSVLAARPDRKGNTAAPEPAPPAPAAEQQLKSSQMDRDVMATRAIASADLGHDLERLLAVSPGSGKGKALPDRAAALQRTHKHIAMLMWIDFDQNQVRTFTSHSPKGSEAEMKQMRRYLAAAKKALKAHRTYESPSFRVEDRSYRLLGQRSEDGRTGVIALLDQDLLSKVEEHQRKNLRLIPYPREGRYRVESVHTDTLRDMTVKTGHDNENASHYYENEIVVRFRNGHPTGRQLRTIARDIHGGSPRKIGYAYIFKSADMNFSQLRTYFAYKWHPQYTEPHYLYLTNDRVVAQTSDEIMPNDLLFSAYQWNLPAIETGKGWALTRGSGDCIVAVVDTGVQKDHPDLQGQLLNGYNAVTGGGSVPDDDVGHGTHVSGIIGALVNNGEGVAGISWYNKILPVKALDASGAGTTYSVAEGIIWAADHGARVINLSLGNYADSQFLHDAVKYAYDRDIVLVSATGNDNTERPGYPAAYPEVLAVGATNAGAERASFSNYGDYVDVCAPGESIASTYIGSQYAALSGTSMASPHVAALAGLVRSLNPDLTNKEVVELMKKNATDLGSPGHDKYFGWGQVDIYRTLAAAAGEDTPLQLWPQRVREKIRRLESRE
ncbi:S8 family peptidase [Paenibacillus glufosinatiresistens]|uniref:S8 family peptidase n=1 Tax=Paenibacillus glufosinatiresistens TaxID=3070657 RepID=UPI00286E7B3F|nr:S8 family peptidase [Paenibacillus sp. YX.27]